MVVNFNVSKSEAMGSRLNADGKVIETVQWGKGMCYRVEFDVAEASVIFYLY